MFEWYRNWKYARYRFWDFYFGDVPGESGIYIQIKKGPWKGIVFSIEPKLLDNYGRFTYDFRVMMWGKKTTNTPALIPIVDEIVEQAMNEIVANYRGLREQVMNSEESIENYIEESDPERIIHKKKLLNG